jgi:hypothetical protein
LSAQAALDRQTKKELFESLKEEKKSKVRSKRLNVLGEEHTEPILFSAENVRHAQAIAAEKEAFKKSERIRIDSKKAAQTEKKQRVEEEKAVKALRAAEKAEKQVQNKKDSVQKKASKVIPVRIKTLVKPSEV